ncbi:MAG TPA: PAS domain S-box protein [Cryomorphaceae bacterium]|nr:PAS domain S-box protein [Cryomorphaceae bacterium]
MRISSPTGIAVLYLTLGLVWILVSDLSLHHIAITFNFSDDLRSFLAVAKGFVYVGLTALLLYALVKNRLKYLTQNRDDFKRFFRDNPNPMWIYDSDTAKFLLVNKAAVNQYGYSEDEFRKMTLFDIRPQSEYDKLRANMSAQGPDLSNSGTWIHRRRDGSTFFVDIFSGTTKFRESNCRIVTAINVDQNYTLQKERKYIQDALDNSALVSTLDVKGKFLEVNERFCATFGWRKEEMIGRDISMLNSGEHEETFWRDLWDTLSKGISWRDDICNLRRNGSKVWMDTVITPLLDDQNEVFRFILIQYDITEKKRLEETKTRLLEDLSKYSFQTSHQLRGPLSRLLGLVQLYEQEENRDFVLREISKTACEIDGVIREMNDALHQNSQEYVRQRFIEK